MINKVKIAIVKLINDNPDISLQEICRILKIKTRSFYLYLKEINQFLKANNLQTIINNNGLFSIEFDFSYFNNLITKKFYLFSQKERIDFICFDIVVFNNNKNLQDYCDFFVVSKSTIVADFKAIKRNLHKSNLNLIFDKNIGYQIKGDQLSIRNIIIDYINEYAISENYLFLNSLFDDNFFENSYTNDLVIELENTLQKSFTSSYLCFIKKYLSILSIYYQKKIFINISECDKEIIDHTKELEVAKKILLNLIGEINCEIYYIAILLLAGNATSNFKKNNILVNSCKEGLVKMINDIEEKNYLFFSDKESLIDDVINHLVPAYYRLKFNLRIGYDYINVVKTKYKDFYLITKNTIYNLEQILKIKFSDDEILLLSLYLVANLLSSIDSIKKIKTIIVTGEGLNICRILKLELENTFFNLDVIKILTLNEFKSYKEHYDLVLSLVPLPNIKYIKIKSTLSNLDKKRINEYILFFLNDVNQKAIHINQVLTEDYIQIFDKTCSWQQAIIKSSKPLLKNKKINDTYVDAMIHNIIKYKSCILLKNDIAMPHASFKDGVNSLGFTLNVFKQPIIFPGKSSRKISLIIVLAPIDNEKHIKPMLELIDRLNDQKTLNKILIAEKTKNIYQIISKVI